MFIAINHGRGQSKKSRRDYRLRRELFAKQKGQCYWCGQQMELEPLKQTIHATMKENQSYASFEHLKPRVQGGRKTKGNIVLAHIRCNVKRSEKKWPHDPIYGQAAE